ncbi:hypothetical protein [Bradyrhizobium sp. JYMT SZCCT0180]|uniref:hypothetical protein n=1 Tax=Bradyrhizobium sp. JYMT SZCCT0180 TaxID=2807666 RepID=UPI001BAB96BC|nr:hypothetical protein [Bradyrhizobium sp. JYMT SZCCT0180]MBR1215935.1 hypothetical protein [Bradyrhizobium sp. JYMT SZCCT0180]
MISEGQRRVVIKSDPYSEPYLEGAGLEFRLTYEGPLLSDSKRSESVRKTRADNKQEIRQAFHKQLKRLWEVNPFLAASGRAIPIPGVKTVIFGRLPYSIEEIAYEFREHGYRFVPLATHKLGVFCSVNVLLMRPNALGGVITNTGDIDNGFKVIFDALSKPRTASQLGKYQVPREGEDPFFCLLEDDKLITKATVESDLMLQPLKDRVTCEDKDFLNPTDARVLVTVKLAPIELNAATAGFA